MWNLQHIIFVKKTKILVDFQICISVPLNNFEKVLNAKMKIFTRQGR